jgi:T-complex protein 1 subunit epsilon
MSVIIDEFGRPIILFDTEDTKKRIKGQEAYKVILNILLIFKHNITAARGVASILKTSLGPKGMDKMLVSPDQEVLVTNDGATIVESMQVLNFI